MTEKTRCTVVNKSADPWAVGRFLSNWALLADEVEKEIQPDDALILWELEFFKKKRRLFLNAEVKLCREEESGFSQTILGCLLFKDISIIPLLDNVSALKEWAEAISTSLKRQFASLKKELTAT